MHLRRLSAATVVTLSAALTRSVQAQGGSIASQCPRGTRTQPSYYTQDACQKAVDLFQFLAPQVGAVIAGGNVEPGQGGTLGGLGHFGVSVRANLLRAPLPQFDRVAVRADTARRDNVPTDNTLIGFPVADAAVGIFRGVPLGIATVGGVDALLNATYVPDIDRDQLSVRTTGGSLKIGYGVRVGILQESLVLPGVSASILRRETPTTRIVAASDDDSVGVSGLRVRTDSWRLTASKRLVVVALAAGVGQDRYDTRANVEGVVSDPSLAGIIAGPVRTAANGLSQKLTRTNYFGNLTLVAIPFVRIVGELGRTTGGTLAPTYNTFDAKRADAGYAYGSIAVRVGR